MADTKHGFILSPSTWLGEGKIRLNQVFVLEGGNNWREMKGLEGPNIDPFALLSSHPPANRPGFGGSLTLPKLTFENLPILLPID